MLPFAEVTNSDATWIGIVSALVVGLPGFGAWLWSVIKSRREAKKQDRADAITEWQNYVNRQDADIKQCRDEISRLQQAERDCMGANAKAAVEAARRDGVIAMLTADVRRLQAISHDTHPGVTVPTIITAGFDGIIYDATAASGPMFHWLPVELRGKNVDVLIPERLKEQHRAAFAQVAAGTRQVDPGKPILTRALRRDGSEFDIVINLSHWKSPRGSEFITAEIREQPSAGDRAVRLHSSDDGNT